MPLSLLKRLPLGHKMTPGQMDQNLTDIEDAINGFEAELAVSLNPDGTLKANSVATTAIQDRAVTLAKLAFLSNFYAVDAGAVNAMAIAFTPVCTLYEAGDVFWVKVVATNTGATTLKVDALAAISVVKASASGLVALTGGELVLNGVYVFVYDGTQFQVLNPTETTTAGPAPLAVPVAVYTGSTIVWTDYDASFLPVGAKFVILQCRGFWDTSNDGTVVTEIRASGSSPSWQLNECGATDGAANVSQGLFPLSSTRHFEYQVTAGDPNGTAEIKLMGYII